MPIKSFNTIAFNKIPFQTKHCLIKKFCLTLKKLGGLLDRPPATQSFLKNASFKERVKPWLFVTLNIIMSHTFPENFIEISSVVQNSWGISRSILTISINFHKFSGFFWHFFVTKKLMTSTYNKWCHHFSTFHILWIDCLTIA